MRREAGQGRKVEWISLSVFVSGNLGNFKLKLRPAGCTNRKSTDIGVKPRKFLVFFRGLQLII